jgi:hypothetical protein
MYSVTPTESVTLPNIETKHSLIPPGTMIDAVATDFSEVKLCLKER